MIGKFFWVLLYLSSCLVFFDQIGYSLLVSIFISIGITALLVYIIYGRKQQCNKKASSLNRYAFLFLVNIVGPAVFLEKGFYLELPFLILGFCVSLYLATQSCLREGFKWPTMIPAIILSSVLFCLAQRWIYVPLTAVNTFLGWAGYSSKTKI